MVRKTYSALAIVAIAALSIVGCGKEDLTDLNETWTKAESGVNEKLATVQGEHKTMVDEFQVVQTANATDSTKLQDRVMVNQMITDHEKLVGEVEATIADLKAKRDAALAAGKRADFEAAWKEAEVKYAAAAETLDKIESQHSDMKSKIESLKSAPAVKDTAAATTAPATKDTVASAKPDTAVVK
jgi:chromosome segregation ATPase